MLKENLKSIVKGAEILKFQGKIISVDIAPEPTAINWNFLHISDDVIKKNTVNFYFFWH